jgi:uncharacterized membrane protein
VRAAAAARRPGTVREFTVSAATGEVDLGGLVAATASYGGRVPGPPIRVRAGEGGPGHFGQPAAQHTTIHWHGVALRNDADGVPDVTRPHIPSGTQHVYQFTAAHPGTYWFHPHAGVQLDRGLGSVTRPRAIGFRQSSWFCAADIRGRQPTWTLKLAEEMRPMHGYGGTWMWPMGGMMIGWLVLTALIVGLVVWLVVANTKPRATEDDRGAARRILAERYARGELDTEDYRQRLANLDH